MLLFFCTNLCCTSLKKKNLSSILLFSCLDGTAVFFGGNDGGRTRTRDVCTGAARRRWKKEKKNAFQKLSYKSINKPWILCLDTWLCCLCKKLLATLLFICLSNPLRLIFSTPEVITRPHRGLKRTVGRISETKLCWLSTVWTFLEGEEGQKRVVQFFVSVDWASHLSASPKNC